MADHAPYVMPAQPHHPTDKKTYIPACSCGWKGRDCISKAGAQRNALNHAREKR